MMIKKTLAISFYKSLKSFGTSLPILLGVILLLGLFRMNVSSQLISSIFKGKLLRDKIIGSIFGSISAGNPITSYIIVREQAAISEEHFRGLGVKKEREMRGCKIAFGQACGLVHKVIDNLKKKVAVSKRHRT